MQIKALRCLKDNWTFLITQPSGTDSGSREICVSIDPGEVTEEMKVELAGRDLKAIMLTHHHHDHIGGVETLLRLYPNAKVFASDRDSRRLEFFGQRPHKFDDLRRFPNLFGNPIEFRSHPIPGHTEGQVAIETRVGSSFPAHFFVGDTLFAFGCGRCLEGTPEQLFQSLQFIKSLPPSSLVYFGHDYELRNMEFWKTWRQDAGPNLVNEAALNTAVSGRAFAKLEFEMQRNPFLKIQDVETFRLWRERRDHF